MYGDCCCVWWSSSYFLIQVLDEFLPLIVDNVAAEPRLLGQTWKPTRHSKLTGNKTLIFWHRHSQIRHKCMSSKRFSYQNWFSEIKLLMIILILQKFGDICWLDFHKMIELSWLDCWQYSHLLHRRIGLATIDLRQAWSDHLTQGLAWVSCQTRHWSSCRTAGSCSTWRWPARAAAGGTTTTMCVRKQWTHTQLTPAWWLCSYWPSHAPVLDPSFSVNTLKQSEMKIEKVIEKHSFIHSFFHTYIFLE